MPATTIFALSSPPGRGGVAVMRVSGPASRALIETLTCRVCPCARQAVLRRLHHGGQTIDRGLVLYFPAPASFTGEDMAEFQVHGGRAVVQSLSAALVAAGADPAAPGDFTKRAFLNGKLDLAQAEGIADLIDAETMHQQQQALAQAEGGLSRLYEAWRAYLLRNLAWLEALLDFPDEDLPDNLWQKLQIEIRGLSQELDRHLSDARRGERLRTGIRIAILGAPNVGKSSLLNALAQRDVAIVSPQAGTTRDVVEVHLDLGGYPVILADTAGLRETADDIERLGIERAHSQAALADLRLSLIDVTEPRPALLHYEQDENTLLVYTKIDLAEPPPGSIAISTVSNAGIENLLSNLTSRVAALFSDRISSPPTRERHRHELVAMQAALTRFATSVTPDIAAEELRLALTCLGRLTGRVDVEDLLDLIFRDFCIGK